MNIHKKWRDFVYKSPINKFNYPSEFDDTLISEKKVITHRIVNLINSTEDNET